MEQLSRSVCLPVDLSVRLSINLLVVCLCYLLRMLWFWGMELAWNEKFGDWNGPGTERNKMERLSGTEL